MAPRKKAAPRSRAAPAPRELDERDIEEDAQPVEGDFPIEDADMAEADASRSRPPARAHGSRRRESERPTRPENDPLWNDDSILTAPPARPGYVQRWVRTSMLGQDDVNNYGKRRRRGWEPRRADTVPGDFHPPTLNHGRFDGCIGVEGSILCEMPEERQEMRREHIRARTDQITDGVHDELRRSEVPGHPFEIQQRSQVTHGRPRVPNVGS